MNTENIANILKTSVLARERLVGNLEKVLEDEVKYINTSLKNTDFLQDAKKAIVTSLQDFKPGEEITMNSYSDYSYTKVSSKGTVVSQQNEKIIVDFYYQTGKTNPNSLDRWDVDKRKAYKTKFYDLLVKFRNYEEAAKNIIDQAMENINLTDVYPGDIEKLVDKDKVYLVNDKSLLEELMQNSLYSKRICLEGAKKYLIGVGVVRVQTNSKVAAKDSYSLEGKNIEKLSRKNEYRDYDSSRLAQVEASQELAELSIMEEAKKVNANYVLINQKHVIPFEDRALTTVIEGLPFMIIGKQEIENLLNKPDLEEKVIIAMKNLVPLEMIKSNYTGLAKFYPQEFITFFSSIESAEQKKMIIESLMKMDYDNKKVITWLDEHESGLVREVGLNLD